MSSAHLQDHMNKHKFALSMLKSLWYEDYENMLNKTSLIFFKSVLYFNHVCNLFYAQEIDNNF